MAGEKITSGLFCWDGEWDINVLIGKMRFFHFDINRTCSGKNVHKSVSIHRAIALVATPSRKTHRKADVLLLLINLMWLLHKIKRNRSRDFSYFNRRASSLFRLIEWCKIYDVSLCDFYVFSLCFSLNTRSRTRIPENWHNKHKNL